MRHLAIRHKFDRTENPKYKSRADNEASVGDITTLHYVTAIKKCPVPLCRRLSFSCYSQ